MTEMQTNEAAAVEIIWTRDLEASMARRDPFHDEYPWQDEDAVLTGLGLNEVDGELDDALAHCPAG